MAVASVVRRRVALPLLAVTSIALVFSAAPAVVREAVAAPIVPVPAGPVNPNAGWVEPTGEGLVRPDFTSASVTARSSGQRVEVLSERSRYERSWVNPDGTVSAEQTGLVRFEDPAVAGGWRDVNITENDKPIWPHCAGLIWPHPRGQGFFRARVVVSR